MKKGIKLTPYTQILLSFALIILIGSILLSLPISSETGESLNFLDAVFTATSAVCVTGLVVNDVSTTYTFFGKFVILVLIQLGGLGILTFSSMMILLISNKMGYYTKKIVSEDINYNIVTEIPQYLKKVSMVVFGIEFIGALLLFIQYITQYSLKKALAFSIFHSISAFCNAGFSLYSNNLEGYVNNPLVNFVISSLIILGGLGFAAIVDIYNVKKGIRRKVSISTKLSLIITISLIFLGTVLIFLLEYNNADSMGNLSFGSKLMAAYFQSVSIRTAGFNTIALSNLKVPTIMLFVFLMYVGASSGSTGGGIKTTTFGILFLGVYAAITGREDIEFGRRKISWSLFNKATAILIMSIMYIMIALFLMTIFENNIDYLKLLFELVSAFGTVGLSTGITANLKEATKIILILTMFIGRIGPLTILFAISKKKIKTGKYKYPEETVLIG